MAEAATVLIAEYVLSTGAGDLPGPVRREALRSFFKWLTRRRGWKHNPLLEVQLPKREKKLPVTLTVAQVEAMLALPL